MSKHSSHLTPVMDLDYPSPWRQTYVLFDLDSVSAQGGAPESNGDRILKNRLVYQGQASNSTAHPYGHQAYPVDK